MPGREQRYERLVEVQTASIVAERLARLRVLRTNPDTKSSVTCRSQRKKGHFWSCGDSMAIQPLLLFHSAPIVLLKSLPIQLGFRQNVSLQSTHIAQIIAGVRKEKQMGIAFTGGRKRYQSFSHNPDKRARHSSRRPYEEGFSPYTFKDSHNYRRISSAKTKTRPLSAATDSDSYTRATLGTSQRGTIAFLFHV